MDILKLVILNSDWFAQYDKDLCEYCTGPPNNPKTHFYTLGFHKYDVIHLPIGLIRNDKDTGLELQSFKNDQVSDSTPMM